MVASLVGTRDVVKGDLWAVWTVVRTVFLWDALWAVC